MDIHRFYRCTGMKLASSVVISPLRVLHAYVVFSLVTSSARSNVEIVSAADGNLRLKKSSRLAKKSNGISTERRSSISVLSVSSVANCFRRRRSGTNHFNRRYSRSASIVRCISAGISVAHSTVSPLSGCANFNLLACRACRSSSSVSSATL